VLPDEAEEMGLLMNELENLLRIAGGFLMGRLRGVLI
jgi:hypothetical protein